MVRRFRAGTPRAAPVKPTSTQQPVSQQQQQQATDPAITKKISETKQRIVMLVSEHSRLEDIQFRTGSGKAELSRKGNEIANARSELRQLENAKRTGETLQSAGQRIARAKGIRAEETGKQRSGFQPKRRGLVFKKKKK